jgi:hypothetical protein
MTIKPRSIATHLAAFVLGVVVTLALHPCTVLTSNPPTPDEPDEPGAADSTGP